MKYPRIIFVCTGNIFRSVSAEYSAKKILGIDDSTQIGSAGIAATPEALPPLILEQLSALGMDATSHRQRKTDTLLLSSYDIVVAMAENHQAYMNARLGVESILFNKLYQGTDDSVLDLHEAIPDFLEKPTESHEYISKTIRYIYDAMPRVLDEIAEKFCTQ